jgi:hypothetical protein
MGTLCPERPTLVSSLLFFSSASSLLQPAHGPRLLLTSSRRPSSGCSGRGTACAMLCGCGGAISSVSRTVMIRAIRSGSIHCAYFGDGGFVLVVFVVVGGSDRKDAWCVG